MPNVLSLEEWNRLDKARQEAAEDDDPSRDAVVVVGRTTRELQFLALLWLHRDVLIDGMRPKCEQCDGKGTGNFGPLDRWGNFRTLAECPDCDGTGWEQ